MEEVDLHKLCEEHGGRLRLSSIVYKRMRQLNAEGMRPPSDGTLLRAALLETQGGKLTFAENATEAAVRALFKGRGGSKGGEAASKEHKRGS